MKKRKKEPKKKKLNHHSAVVNTLAMVSHWIPESHSTILKVKIQKSSHSFQYKHCRMCCSSAQYAFFKILYGWCFFITNKHKPVQGGVEEKVITLF